MCRNCVPTLMNLADDSWRSADEQMRTSVELAKVGDVEGSLEMQHWSNQDQSFGMVFQALANIMASITRDDTDDDDIPHPPFDPSQN